VRGGSSESTWDLAGPTSAGVLDLRSAVSTASSREDGFSKRHGRKQKQGRPYYDPTIMLPLRTAMICYQICLTSSVPSKSLTPPTIR
jgi:hypothetical protein